MLGLCAVGPWVLSGRQSQSFQTSAEAVFGTIFRCVLPVVCLLHVSRSPWGSFEHAPAKVRKYSKALGQRREAITPTDFGLALPAAEKVAIAKSEEHSVWESKSLLRLAQGSKFVKQ